MGSVPGSALIGCALCPLTTSLRESWLSSSGYSLIAGTSTCLSPHPCEAVSLVKAPVWSLPFIAESPVPSTSSSRRSWTLKLGWTHFRWRDWGSERSHSLPGGKPRFLWLESPESTTYMAAWKTLLKTSCLKKATEHESPPPHPRVSALVLNPKRPLTWICPLCTYCLLPRELDGRWPELAQAWGSCILLELPSVFGGTWFRFSFLVTLVPTREIFEVGMTLLCDSQPA